MARYEREDMGPDDDDSEDEMGAAQNKAKPRRKSHQRPQGSDQIRQAFSKRKKGLVLKAYQLNALTDAKVFMFITNDKGTSWAYATPGFSNALDPELLKQLRALAHVPESAKLITEVMPDPLNAKQPTDTAAAAEHAVTRRGDQVPSSLPCTRAATGTVPARSRSSYSGDGVQAGTSSNRVPLARSDSTTTNTRAQSLGQFDDLPHDKQQHARPPSGSSMAGCARSGSAAAAAHSPCLQQQQQRGQSGKLLGLEPPTPCGMYNLMGQPAAVHDSPTVVSDMAASCSSPSSSKQQQMLPPDLAAGVRLAAVANVAAAGGMPVATSQGGNEGWQQQQQELQQQADNKWQNHGYQQQQYPLQQHHIQQQQQYQQAGDGWVAVEVNNQHCFGAGGDKDSKCQVRLCSTGYPAAGPDTAAPAVMWPPALQQFADNQQQQQSHQMLSSSAPDSAAGAAGCSFEHMMRGLPALRVRQQAVAAAAVWRGAGGTRSAPAGVAGMPSQGLDSELKPDNLQQMSDARCYASSSGYSSYGASPSCNANASMQRAASSPVDGQSASPAVRAAGSAPPGATASMLLAMEAASADPSPTAALSSQLCSLLAMDSPMHEGFAAADHHQQQQHAVWQERNAAEVPGHSQVHAASHHQQQQQQHDQGTYMPRTDDLVSDPLMEMLMDQAMAGGSCCRPGSSGGQQHHMSIMEATLQQEQQQPKKLQQQSPRMQAQYFAGSSQQQQMGQDSQQQYSQQQQQVQHSMPISISWGTSLQQQQEQQQLLQLSGLLQHFPLPPKSTADKPAWQEQVRQVLLSLQLQPQQQQQLMTLIRDREQQALLARSGSATCSPVLPLSSCSSPGMLSVPQPHQMLSVPGGGHSGASSAGVNYLARGAGPLCLQQGGGKQRHGPSRLSATSPAIDAAAAAPAAGMEAGGMPGHMQGCIVGYVGQAGLSSAPMPPQQQQQNVGAAEASAMPVPSNCMPMPAPVLVSASMAAAVSAGYSLPPVMQQQQVCGTGGMMAAASYGCIPQMMSVPVSSYVMMAMQPSVGTQQQQQQQQQGVASMAAVAGSPHAVAALQVCSRQASPAASDPGTAAATAASSPAAASLQQQHHPVSFTPGSLLADLQQQQQLMLRAGSAACSSPLKRNQPCVGAFALPSSAAAFAEAVPEAMSPLKRACRQLPEPPRFAALLQTELGEDDAVAWAASAAANDSLKVAGNPESCGSFLKCASLGKLHSGSLPAFVTVGGNEAAAAQVAAGYGAGRAAGAEAVGLVGICGTAADGGEGDDDEANTLQAVLAEADGTDGEGCVLDDHDTEMGDAAAGDAEAAAHAAAAAAADGAVQQLAVDADCGAEEVGV